MKWSLAELNKFRGTQVTFNEEVDVSDSLLNREPSILKITPVKVDGFIDVDPTSYVAHFTMDTVVTLPSTRSLEPVDVPLNLVIDEVYMTEQQLANLSDVSEEEKSLIMPLEKDLIDLKEAIEDFILLNLPLQVLTEEEQHATELPKGDFWHVVSESDYIEPTITDSEPTIDPRLAKLSELFKEDTE
ncbi:hypothetical protein CBF34_06855 [Vagococcus penaei]|uniref:Nucleic acid-binding protein n=2 Tax=Vagococcus penaei TaxID=633807 RepID=A0A1Q2D3H3_9ENTE|nr:YceD family protein [Vagococcus penaei]AQP52883.1 nucleic acid-binding protein [Vagococcus penaei]RSU01372.1 hypothetical protein CBF34_06855 [Vagococcus penaei]